MTRIREEEEDWKSRRLKSVFTNFVHLLIFCYKFVLKSRNIFCLESGNFVGIDSGSVVYQHKHHNY